MPSSENVVISCKKSVILSLHLQLFIVEIEGPSRLIQKFIDHWETKSNENHPKNVLIWIKKNNLQRLRKGDPFLTQRKLFALQDLYIFLYISINIMMMTLPL